MAKLSAVQIANAAKAAGFTGKDVAIAVAVAFAESGGESTASHKNSNGSTDYGLWQINSIHSAVLRSGSWSNPNDNAKMAYKVFSEAGKKWTPWVTYKSGSYLKFLGKGNDAAGNATGTPVLSIPGSAELGAIKKFAEFIIDPHNWLRVGLFVAGTILLVIALFKMTGDNKLSGTTKAVIGAAIKVPI
jgi:hypothetical protein